MRFAMRLRNGTCSKELLEVEMSMAGFVGGEKRAYLFLPTKGGCLLMWSKRAKYYDSQTWFATDISIEIPKKPPLAGAEILEVTPLL